MSNETKTPTTVCGESTVVGETIKENNYGKRRIKDGRESLSTIAQIYYITFFFKSQIFFVQLYKFL